MNLRPARRSHRSSAGLGDILYRSSAREYAVADTVAPTTMTYDILDRDTKTTIPDASFTTIGATQFETVVTDANVNAGRPGAVKRTYRDVRELITSVKEFNQGATLWTSYGYDALKQITQVVDNLSDTTVKSYEA
jgi:hypothetical protein